MTAFAFERIERRETITTTTLWRPGEPEKLSSRTVVITRYTVTGVKPVSLYGNAQRGRLYMPVAVVVEHTGGETTDVRVDGRLYRKDGSLGESTFTLHGLSGMWRASTRPEWLTEIAEDAAR